MTGRIITLQRAAPADASKILKFIHKAHAAHQGDLPPIVDRFALPWITNIICFGIAFCACIDGRIIGTIGFDKQGYPWNEYKSYMHSQWLHVLDSHINSSVRDRLIEKSKDAAEEMGYCVFVNVPHYLFKDSDLRGGMEAGHHFGGYSHA